MKFEDHPTVQRIRLKTVREEAPNDDAPNTFDDRMAPKGESIPAYSQAELYARMVQDWKVKQAGKLQDGRVLLQVLRLAARLASICRGDSCRS